MEKKGGEGSKSALLRTYSLTIPGESSNPNPQADLTLLRLTWHLTYRSPSTYLMHLPFLLLICSSHQNTLTITSVLS